MPLLLLVSGCQPESPAPTVAPLRNLLMLSVDTLRRDDVGRYGDEDATPFLDGRAAEGLALDDHTTCSTWTLPGVMCALGGANPEERGFVMRSPVEQGTAIPEDIELLPTWLSAAGFQTTLISTNRFLGAPDGAGSRYDAVQLVNEDAAGVVDLALELVEAGGIGPEQPWMLHLHFIDPHLPYDPPLAYLSALDGRPELAWDLSTTEGTRTLAAEWTTLTTDEQREASMQLRIRHLGEVTYVDDQIARLWGALEDAGLLDDTLVSFWSDHGEQLYEHGSLGHAGDIWPETNEAVAFFWSNGTSPVAWTEPTRHADLAPTVLEELGVAMPEGLSGVPVGSTALAPDFALVWPSGEEPSQSVRDGGYRLVYRWDGRRRLMRLGDDPREERLTYASDDAEVIRLWELLLPEVERIAALVTETSPVSPGP